MIKQRNQLNILDKMSNASENILLCVFWSIYTVLKCTVYTATYFKSLKVIRSND